jgi:hypothetical protein
MSFFGSLFNFGKTSTRKSRKGKKTPKTVVRKSRRNKKTKRRKGLRGG